MSIEGTPLSPLLAGMLFVAGAARLSVSVCFALASLLAGLTLVLTFYQRRHDPSGLVSAWRVGQISSPEQERPM